MLGIFCLRLAWGLSAGLLLFSPRDVNPRFYRVQFQIVLGLLACAAFVFRDSASGWLWTALALGGCCAFAGSVVWSLEGAPAGSLPILVAVLLLGLALCSSAHAILPEVGWSTLLVEEFSSAAVLGAATTAMLMGHSYLIAPSMSIRPLMSSLVAVVTTTALRAALALVGLWSWTATHSLVNVEDESVWWLPVRWGLGLIGPLILSGMAWNAARIRSTQSATGILYVVVILCFLGELTSQVLLGSTGYFL
jgi:hypothetical protein